LGRPPRTCGAPARSSPQASLAKVDLPLFPLPLPTASTCHRTPFKAREKTCS
jgi:hypothetical protein